MPRGSEEVSTIDKSISNKFRWVWLQKEEQVSHNGQTHTISFDCFEKLDIPGIAECTISGCNGRVRYASEGVKALNKHVQSSKHVQAWLTAKSNMQISVADDALHVERVISPGVAIPMKDMVPASCFLPRFAFNKAANCSIFD